MGKGLSALGLKAHIAHNRNSEPLRFLTLPEAAELLQVSKRTLLRVASRKKIARFQGRRTVAH